MDIHVASENNEFGIVPDCLDVLFVTTVVIYLVIYRLRPPCDLDFTQPTSP